ncbi:Uncharacterized conserved protein [Pedobacter steynii]|uniref:Uncharacterized conserved protein n=1 Tax=Pedobacter steynii TaxID=430522 RepID=A0A1H0A9R8_9SPHI|nr:esterase-like activity of phytase family protein [Pedobacter steynii]NQX41422.1 esterase-like activity of phytase family protein [Pedobacter steynii]SDN30187.1 Uncharacterized conserved protein [Pedobacter steynii]
MQKLFSSLLGVGLISFSVSCGTYKAAAEIKLKTTSHFNYLGSCELPYGLQYRQTTVGGLSGIDYDPVHQVYYLISDDRSAINPARFYTAKIKLTANGIDTVMLTGTQKLPVQRKGVPDPEAIRYSPVSGRLVWSSEGDRNIKSGSATLIDPSIQLISRKGKIIQNFILPESLKMSTMESGPQNNEVLEGLTFSGDGKILYASMEGPLYEDKLPAFQRVYQFDVASGVNTAQYFYKSEKGYGITDILNVNDRQFLFTERSWSKETKRLTVMVYLADFQGATDLMQYTDRGGSEAIPIRKKLLLDFSKLSFPVDNIEGATLGPQLPNGHPTLLFVSDNNFNPEQITQFLLFELVL